MKRYILSLSLASALFAGIQVKSGWSMVSTGGVDSLDASCILQQLPSGSVVWSYKDDAWMAKSNSEQVNNLISGHNIALYNSIGRYDGFWVFNSSTDPVNIEMNCSHQYNRDDQNGSSNDQNSSSDNIESNFTFGGNITFTTTDLLQQGNTFFDVSNTDGYDKTVVSSGAFIDTWYDCDGGQCTQEEDDTITIGNINSDNNISVTIDSGEQGDLVINSAKSITAVDGNDTTGLGLKLIDLTYTVTVSGSGHWDDREEDTYYDQSTNSQQYITDIVTLKNQYINPNSSYWFGDDDNGDVYIFAESNDTSITSGNVVKAIQDGYHSNGHKRYVRGTEVVGTWTLSNGVLTADTPTKIKKWRFNNGTFQELEIEKPGSTYHMKWITGNSPSYIEQVIRSFYQ